MSFYRLVFPQECGGKKAYTPSIPNLPKVYRDFTFRVRVSAYRIPVSVCSLMALITLLLLVFIGVGSSPPSAAVAGGGLWRCGLSGKCQSVAFSLGRIPRASLTSSRGFFPWGHHPSVTAQLWAVQTSECSGVSDLRSCILLLKALTGSKSPQWSDRDSRTWIWMWNQPWSIALKFSFKNARYRNIE